MHVPPAQRKARWAVWAVNLRATRSDVDPSRSAAHRIRGYTRAKKRACRAARRSNAIGLSLSASPSLQKTAKPPPSAARAFARVWYGCRPGAWRCRTAPVRARMPCRPSRSGDQPQNRRRRPSPVSGCPARMSRSSWRLWRIPWTTSWLTAVRAFLPNAVAWPAMPFRAFSPCRPCRVYRLYSDFRPDRVGRL
jgi:hypothetical protein